MNFPHLGIPHFRGVAFFAGGFASAVVAMTIFQHDPAAPSLPPHPAVAPASQNASAPPVGDAAPRTRAARADQESLTRLSDALADPDGDHRREALRHLAGALAERDMKAALDTGARIPDGGDKIEFLRAVFGKWGAREPAQALAQALMYPPGMLRAETLNGALESWAAREPRAALAWLDANVSGPLKEESRQRVESHAAARP